MLALADCKPSPLIAVTAAAVSITVDSDFVAVTTNSSKVAWVKPVLENTVKAQNAIAEVL